MNTPSDQRLIEGRAHWLLSVVADLHEDAEQCLPEEVMDHIGAAMRILEVRNGEPARKS